MGPWGMPFQTKKNFKIGLYIKLYLRDHIEKKNTRRLENLPRFLTLVKKLHYAS